MAEMLIDGAKLDACNTAEANAIRAKTGSTDLIPYDYANNKGFADAIAAIPSGGGGENFKGLQLVSVDSATGRPTEYKWKGDTIPAYGLYYCYYGTGVNQRCTLDLSEVEYVNTYGLCNTGLEVINATNIKEMDSYAFGSRISVNANDLRSKTLNLANYTGYGLGGKTNINSVMRSGDQANFYGTILCPIIVHIPQYMLYANKNNMTVQLGSVGHAVQTCGGRPFGSAATGTNTVTTYVTGDKLDTIKDAIQEQTPSTTTFIYKAAEATEYGGVSYAAGDTMLTVGGA